MTDIILIDGGMGQEVIRRSGEKPHPLWSSKIMLDQPEIVFDIHKDFIKAGARVITINSYSVTPGRLLRDGEPGWFEKLQEIALSLALKAASEVENSREPISVAGCLPPLYASYHPETSPKSYEECYDQYCQISALQAEKVDLFLCETMSSIKEAKASANAGLDSGKTTWSAFSVSDGSPKYLRSGEPLEKAVEELSDIPIGAMLLNCSTPESITEAMNKLKDAKVPFGAYANGFTSVDALKPGGTVDSLESRFNLSPIEYSEFVFRWLDMGATIVGGCCEIGINHIEYLAESLEKKGCRLVGFK